MGFSGYITDYNFNSLGNINGTLNTLNNTKINISGSVIKNVWNIVSPNTIDQILIMTKDSKYLFLNDSKNITFSFIIFQSILFLNFNLLSDKLPTSQSNIYNKNILNSLYASLYFITKYKFKISGYNFIRIISGLIRSVENKEITSLSTLDPNYSKWNQISDPILKNLFMFYAIFIDRATNNSNSLYYKLLLNIDPTFQYINVPLTDFQYTANYFHTLYLLYNKVPSDFCVNVSGTLTTPLPICDYNVTSCNRRYILIMVNIVCVLLIVVFFIIRKSK